MEPQCESSDALHESGRHLPWVMLGLCVVGGSALLVDATLALGRVLVFRDDAHTAHLVSSHPGVVVVAIGASLLEILLGFGTLAVGFFLKKGIHRLFCTVVAVALCFYSRLSVVVGVPILLYFPVVRWYPAGPSPKTPRVKP